MFICGMVTPFVWFAAHNTPRAFADTRERAPFRPNAGHPFRSLAETKQVFHVADIMTLPIYKEGDLQIVEAVELGKMRTCLGVPMLKDNNLIGAVLVFRQEVRLFTANQIALITNFAAQAVIAVENARLLNDLRQRTTDLSQRTTDLTEALEQQTATSEVLKVISSSPGDLQPVFDAMLEKAVRICQADAATLFLYENGVLRRAARHSGVADVVMPITPSAKSGTMRSITTKQIVHIPNYLADPAYLEGNDDFVVAAAERLAIRASLHVPMFREPDVVGAFTIWRTDARAFTERQIELVANFAAQAVIAIENARLLNELRQRTDDLSESLQQQTATSDVLKVISRSAFDLQGVFDTLISSAVELSGAFNGTICLRDGDGYRYLATAGIQGEFRKYLSEHPPKPGRASAAGRVLLSGEVVSVPDVLKDPDYIVPAFDLNKTRSVLGVPLLREDKVEGALVLARVEPGLFTQRHIDLVQSFADQAVIAIENVRLFDEVQGRTKELSLSLEELRTAQDRLIQTEKLASLGQLTAGIAHEIKNPLNFVNNFSSVSVELIDELQEALQRVQADDKTRSEIGELADTLRDNLGKIVQHGRRADAIVKNMLLHSRESSGEHRSVDINALVDESLNLAYHGARAEKQGFTITLERSFDPAAGEVDLFPQEITRALLNLISNGFYAVTKRKAEANGGSYEPTLTATTKGLGDSVEIRIRDNGTGIPPEAQEKLFNPFFTTKPAGEGTGLGLSISHDIIVKQHGGSIEVDTQLGEFTEFRIVLPRAGASLLKSGERM